MMKTISICFILLSLYTISFAQPSPPVLDIAGKELLAGVDYYILSVIRGAGGGGLSLDSTGNKSCPLDAIVQERSDLQKGLPTYFRPVNPNDNVVRLSTDLNVIFNASSTCVQSSQWKVNFGVPSQRYFVSTGGVEGNPGRETISNWFKIEKFESGYKFVYCPGVCDTCRPFCGELSTLVQNFKRRLVLSLDRNERPFMVKFQRV